jgi:electron transfer flavoprotein alpha subunit
MSDQAIQHQQLALMHQFVHLIFQLKIYQAKLNEKIKLNNQGIVSFQAGSYSSENIIEGSCSIEEKSLDLQLDLTVRPGERFKESAEGVDLSNAEVIVSIGRGVGKIENVELVKSLAEKLNAQIGASRPVVDAGWLDHSYQIGSSGQTVSPKLYLAVGISGAIQHLVGMKGAKNIIAINKDPNAPIFEISDYAVLGDIFEILPKLIEEL